MSEEEKKNLTEYDPAVKKEIIETLKITSGLGKQINGLEKKLKSLLQKAGEDTGQGGT